MSLYLDYIRFAEICPRNFGAVVLLWMAYEAHCLGFSNIELLAAGGSGVKGTRWSEEFWGYEAWPRLGFDTVLHPAILKLIENEPHLQGIRRQAPHTNRTTISRPQACRSTMASLARPIVLGLDREYARQRHLRPAKRESRQLAIIAALF
jgi:hypothetical protein